MHKTATNIVGKLQDHGFTAFLVGGCVRDLLLGQEPKDYDIATNAKPEEVEAVFENTWPIGKSFGVILIEEAGHKFEVATFREEDSYQDGRRPTIVKYSNAEEDALRRDFTINGIFYDPIIDKHYDYVGGRKDLADKVLRFIGNPDTRVQEDFLRLLRAVRFRHRFSLDYDYDTGVALKTHASLVTQIAAERVSDELNKIIVHKSRAAALADLFNLGILAKLFPEVEALANTDQPSDHHQEGDVLTHTFLVLQQMNEGEDLALYWAAFFHDYAKAKCKKWDGERWTYPGHDQVADDLVAPLLERLKFSKKLQTDILWLLHYKPIFESFYEMNLSKRLHYFDEPQFENLLKLEMADLKGCVPEDEKEHQTALLELKKIQENWQYAHHAGILPSSKPELYTGEEIIEITGIPPSARIGELKAALRERQINGEISTRKEAKAWLLSL
ncbi:CCA tRNA nucleotidyltransferase [bacterium]|nr:CCA tRNA nucleotidyltransferase [bacterium]NCQ55464.1 CCA tRNA nucleotidyltransferase [Candidatus Parcubacteria bacterium]NCS67826.1 CCA tRNA nucleotidyltransferase [Candidatus Peregrinibacteria bacterium]NCS96360.1 CCA tRNA nucleotidyltransferase [bacterium]